MSLLRPHTANNHPFRHPHRMPTLLEHLEARRRRGFKMPGLEPLKQEPTYARKLLLQGLSFVGPVYVDDIPGIEIRGKTFSVVFAVTSDGTPTGDIVRATSLSRARERMSKEGRRVLTDQNAIRRRVMKSAQGRVKGQREANEIARSMTIADFLEHRRSKVQPPQDPIPGLGGGADPDAVE